MATEIVPSLGDPAVVQIYDHYAGFNEILGTRSALLGDSRRHHVEPAYDPSSYTTWGRRLFGTNGLDFTWRY